jgi:hypothetical protein
MMNSTSQTLDTLISASPRFQRAVHLRYDLRDVDTIDISQQRAPYLQLMPFYVVLTLMGHNALMFFMLHMALENLYWQSHLQHYWKILPNSLIPLRDWLSD